MLSCLTWETVLYSGLRYGFWSQTDLDWNLVYLLTSHVASDNSSGPQLLSCKNRRRCKPPLTKNSWEKQMSCKMVSCNYHHLGKKIETEDRDRRERRGKEGQREMMPIHLSSPALDILLTAGVSVFSEVAWKEWAQKEVLFWWRQREVPDRGKWLWEVRRELSTARSYSQGLHVNLHRCYPFPLPPTHLLSPKQSQFPMVLYLRRSFAVYLLKELVHFLVPGLVFSSSSQGVSVSVRFQPSRLDFGSHLLEWFPGDCSQPKNRGTHTGFRWELPHLRDLELLWWNHELWASSSNEKKHEIGKGFGLP